MRVTDLAPDHRVGDSHDCERDLALTARQVRTVERHFVEHGRNFFLLVIVWPWRNLLSDFFDRHLFIDVFMDFFGNILSVVVDVHVHVGGVVLVLGVVLML